MIIIEIDSTATKEKSGISKKTGEVWKMVFQQVAISGHLQDGLHRSTLKAMRLSSGRWARRHSRWIWDRC